MASLYKSASRFGAALLRIAEGSARAAFHDHPEWGIKDPDKAARSIAKRVAGTVAADWARLSAVAVRAGTVARAVSTIYQVDAAAADGAPTTPAAGMLPHFPGKRSAPRVAIGNGAGSLARQRSDIRDASKLDIRGDAIHCRLYQQDGSMQSMVYPDTPFNRLFVSWVQVHDRM